MGEEQEIQGSFKWEGERTEDSLGRKRVGIAWDAMPAFPGHPTPFISLDVQQLHPVGGVGLKRPIGGQEADLEIFISDHPASCPSTIASSVCSLVTAVCYSVVGE